MPVRSTPRGGRSAKRRISSCLLKEGNWAPLVKMPLQLSVLDFVSSDACESAARPDAYVVVAACVATLRMWLNMMISLDCGLVFLTPCRRAKSLPDLRHHL